jgi:hypothetical protein
MRRVVKEKKTLSPIRKISCDKDVVHTSSAKFRPHATEKLLSGPLLKFSPAVELYLNRRHTL